MRENKRSLSSNKCRVANNNRNEKCIRRECGLVKADNDNI